MPLSIDKSVLKISELVSEYTKDVQEEIGMHMQQM